MSQSGRDELVFSISGAEAMPLTKVAIADLSFTERQHLQEWVIANPAVERTQGAPAAHLSRLGRRQMKSIPNSRTGQPARGALLGGVRRGPAPRRERRELRGASRQVYRRLAEEGVEERVRPLLQPRSTHAGPQRATLAPSSCRPARGRPTT